MGRKREVAERQIKRNGVWEKRRYMCVNMHMIKVETLGATSTESL